jgi:trehalose-6-phosphate synthase
MDYPEIQNIPFNPYNPENVSKQERISLSKPENRRAAEAKTQYRRVRTSDSENTELRFMQYLPD